MNFLHMGRISWDSVALNIMTCFCVGVALKMSWTSRRISGGLAQLNVRMFVICFLFTNLVQHFIAFIEDKDFDVSKAKLLLSD